MRISIVALAVAAGALPAWGQAVANATIRGDVTDTTGAAVPGAQIKATQTATGQLTATVSGNDGSYVLLNLPVGPYKVEVTAPSFSTTIRSGILLQVGNNVQLNLTLQLGAVAQEVVVSSGAAMVETQDTSISEVIDQRRIVDLPLNGRQATDLILLSGGASIPPNAAGRFITTHDYATSVGISIAGGQENGNNYLLDGGDHNDTHSNVNLPFPFPDALQEFSVQTNGASARYGLHPYAVVNAVTKSGTNKIHGDFFEFIRNGAFNSRNHFAATQDSLRRNQFGGDGGGPIIKDKLFIFNGFQATRTRTAPPQSIAFVPTPAMLSGDFSTVESAACQSSGKNVALIDPSNGQPFPGNVISPTRFSAPAVGITKLIPAPTDPCGRFTYAIPNPNNENQYVARVDWLQSSKHTIYGRVFLTDFSNPVIYKDNLLTTTRSGLEERASSGVIADQYSLPGFVNAFHGTFTRLVNNRATSPEMPSVVSLGSNMFNAFPHFIDLTVSNKFVVGGGSNAPAVFARNTFQYADDVDLIRGRHHIMLGGEIIRMQMDETNIGIANGQWTFNGSLTGDANADFLIGRPNLLNVGSPTVSGLRQHYYGLYVQDDVRVTKKLNVHAGLRWEPSLPGYDEFGRGSHFSLPAFLAGQRSSVYTNGPAGLTFNGDPDTPRGFAGHNWLGFAPRLGFAYDPSGKGTHSIRASYGIYFETPESYTERDLVASAPWGNALALTGPVGGLSNPFQGYPGGNPFPLPYPPTANTVFPAAGSYVNFPLNLHHMYHQQWDFSYQRQLAGDWLVTAAYLGSKATHLRASSEQNPAIYIPGASTVGNTQQRRLLTQLNPTQGAFFSKITLADDGVSTSFNGMRLSAQHRFSHNFTVLSVYTWSHCMQNAETYGNRLGIGGASYQNPYNRNADTGPCDFDLRHNAATSAVYETPKFSNPVLNQVLSHWQLGGLFTVHTGFAFTPTTGVDNSLTGLGQDRPNVVGSPYVRDTNSLVWINSAAFVPNPLGTFGNAGYNSLIGPHLVNVDANIVRFFNITEHHRVQLRFEFFNVLNHTNYNLPVSARNSSTFGRIQSSGDPRILQFAAKYSF